jgi:ATP-binding cassette subfamily B protein
MVATAAPSKEVAGGSRSLLLALRILILDEATAFLDASEESRLKDTVRTFMAGKTTLVISHRMSTLRGADKVVTLDPAGRVVANGAADLPKRRPRLGPAAADPGGRQVKAASRAPHSAGPLASLARNIHWHIFGAYSG